MAKKKEATPTFKVHRTSEARTGLVDKLIDSGYEVLQTKLGIAITFGDGKQNGIRFTLQTNSIGAQGFGEIAAQSRVAEGMFKTLATILETPADTAANVAVEPNLPDLPEWDISEADLPDLGPPPTRR